MRTVTLKDGTQYEMDWCHGDKGILNINIITSQSLVQLAAVFGDEDRVSFIHADFGSEMTEDYEGYTRLRSISVDASRTGTTLITLVTPEREALF